MLILQPNHLDVNHSSAVLAVTADKIEQGLPFFKKALAVAFILVFPQRQSPIVVISFFAPAIPKARLSRVLNIKKLSVWLRGISTYFNHLPFTTRFLLSLSKDG